MSLSWRLKTIQEEGAGEDLGTEYPKKINLAKVDSDSDEDDDDEDDIERSHTSRDF